MRLDAVHMPPELSSALPPRCHECREQLLKSSVRICGRELVYKSLWQKWFHRWGGIWGRSGALSTPWLQLHKAIRKKRHCYLVKVRREIMLSARPTTPRHLPIVSCIKI